MEILASEIGSKLIEIFTIWKWSKLILREFWKHDFWFLSYDILCISIYDSNNQNLISVMYFGSFFIARNTDTYSYFKRGIFGANSGWTFTNLQTNAPRVSNETTLFQQKKLVLNTIKYFKILLNLLTVRIWYCD